MNNNNNDNSFTIVDPVNGMRSMPLGEGGTSVRSVANLLGGSWLNPQANIYRTRNGEQSLANVDDEVLAGDVITLALGVKAGNA